MDSRRRPDGYLPPEGQVLGTLLELTAGITTGTDDLDGGGSSGDAGTILSPVTGTPIP